MKHICLWLYVLGAIAFTEIRSYSQETTGVRIRTTIPIHGKGWNDIFRSCYDIYHSDNLTLYRITVNFDSSVTHVLSGKEEYFIQGDIRYMYFVFAKDSLYGLNYNTVDRRRGIQISRIPVDSIKRKNTANLEMEPDENGKKWVPDSIYTTAEGDLTNTYKFKKDKQYPEDWIFNYHYSKKFDGVTETFAAAYDTIKGMKLFIVSLNGRGGYYEKEKFMMPARTYLYEMEKVSAQDIDTANIFFEKYKAYYKNNK